MSENTDLKLSEINSEIIRIKETLDNIRRSL